MTIILGWLQLPERHKLQELEKDQDQEYGANRLFIDTNDTEHSVTVHDTRKRYCYNSGKHQLILNGVQVTLS